MSRCRFVKRALSALVVVLGSVGCKASLSADAKASASTSGDAEASAEASGSVDGKAETEKPDFDKPLEEPQRESREEDEALPASEPALIGARQDLAFNGPARATCECLAVHVGQASDPAFVWELSVPSTDRDSQLVIGLSSRNVACSRTGPQGLGASYQGFRVSGQDVIVLVEEARDGRPLTSGAIIPRPGAGGQVFVSPASKDVPYGRSSNGASDRCALGNPGATAAPISETAAPAEEAASPAGITRATAKEIRPEEDSPDDFGEQGEFEAGGDEIVADRVHDGFYLRLSAGLGYQVFSVSSSTADADASGLAYPFDFMIGGSLAQGVALGGMLSAAVTRSPTVDPGDATLDGTNLNLFRAGAFIDYYPSPTAGFHLLGDVAFAEVSATDDRTNFVSGKVTGFSLGAGVGYEWWVSDSWSLGVMGRFAWAILTSDRNDNDYMDLLPGIQFTASYN